MSKVLTIVVVVVGAAIAGDRVLGTLASARGSVSADVSADVKQFVEGSKSGQKLDAGKLQPTSEMGADLKAVMVKGQKRDAQLEEDLKNCNLDQILEWEHVSVPEGRKDALKRLDDQLEAYRSYFADTCKLRGEIARLMQKHQQGGTTSLDRDTAEEGKLHRARAELFGKYAKYIEAVGKSELIEQSGEVLFVNKSDRRKCEVLLTEALRREKDFERHQTKLIQTRTERQEAARERLASLN